MDQRLQSDFCPARLNGQLLSKYLTIVSVCGARLRRRNIQWEDPTHTIQIISLSNRSINQPTNQWSIVKQFSGFLLHPWNNSLRFSEIAYFRMLHVPWSMITLFYKQWTDKCIVFCESSLFVDIKHLHKIRIMSTIKNFSFISSARRSYRQIFMKFASNFNSQIQSNSFYYNTLTNSLTFCFMCEVTSLNKPHATSQHFLLLSILVILFKRRRLTLRVTSCLLIKFTIVNETSPTSYRIKVC